MAQFPTARIADSFLHAVATRLTIHRPERGGAILGFGGTAHLLVEDDFGDYGAAHWDISKELSEAVGILELKGLGQLIGTVHTHPSGVWDPSGQDVQTMTNAMELNPHLDQLLVCVVTEGRPRATDLAIAGGHRMSVHVIRRTHAEGVEFRRAKPVVVPLREVLAGLDLSAAEAISVTGVREADTDRVAPILTTGGREHLVAPVPDTDDAWLLPPGLPGQKPLLGALTADGMRLVPLEWDARVLASQMRATMAERSVAEDTSLERVEELVGSLNDHRVLVAGAGSVGSRIAEDLVRSGVNRMILLDPDVVSMPNMARSVYIRRDIGTPKVDALAERLEAINPRVEIERFASALEDVDLPGILDGVDLVVLATDDMAQQSQLASLAYRKGIMHVSSALFRKAAAGEVSIVVPEAATPCWACAIGTAALSASERSDTNYGVNGRLVAESGLGASINLVASAASLAVIGLLAGPDSPAGASLTRLIAEHRTVGIIATTPSWGLFTDVFEQMAHQSHPQSVWPRIQPVDGCPTCSPQEPADIMTGKQISLEKLAALDA